MLSETCLVTLLKDTLAFPIHVVFLLAPSHKQFKPISSITDSCFQPAKFQFVDQGPELENYYSQDDFAVNNAKPVAEEQRQDNTRLDPYKRLQHRLDPDLWPTLHGAPSSEPLPFLSPTTSNNETALVRPLIATKRRRTTDSTATRQNSGAESWQQQTAYDPVRGDTSHIYRIYTLAKPYSPVGVNGVIAMGEPRHIPKVVEAEYGRLADSAAATIPDESLLSPAAWKEDFYWPNKNTTTQCACLMRYYIDHLAAWVSCLLLLHNQKS